jgi:hypothetical protein
LDDAVVDADRIDVGTKRCPDPEELIYALGG